MKKKLRPVFKKAQNPSAEAILHDPVTQLRMVLANMQNPDASFGPEQLDQFTTLLYKVTPDGKYLDAEMQKMLDAVTKGAPPEDANLSRPETQLLWAVGLTYVTKNYEGLQAFWPGENKGKSLDKTLLWQALSTTPIALQELSRTGRHAESVTGKQGVKLAWSAPGSWFRFNAKSNSINADFLTALIAGFEHTRAVLMHEVGRNQLTRKFPPSMQKIQQELHTLKEREKTQKGKLSKDDYMKMRMLRAEWQMRMELFHYTESAVANRFAVNKSGAQDLGYSLNHTATTIFGLGGEILQNLQEPSNDNPEPTAENRLRTIFNAVHTSFYKNNGYFKNTAEHWKRVGVIPEMIRRDNAPANDNPTRPGSEFHADFDLLMELCGGKDGLEHAQPSPRDLIQYGPEYYRLLIQRHAEKRNEIFQRIWDEYIEPFIDEMREQIKEEIEKDAEKKDNEKQDGDKQDGQDKDDQGNDGQDQDGQEGQDSQQGKPGKGKKGKPQKNSKPQKGERGEQSDEQEQSDDANPDGQDQNGQPKDKQQDKADKQKQKKDKKKKGEKGDKQDQGESGDDAGEDGQDQDGQDQDGETPGDGQEDGQDNDGQMAKDLANSGKSDKNVDVDGVGDMPDVDEPPENPGPGDDSDGEGGEGEGKEKGEPGEDGNDGKTIEELMEEMEKRKREKEAREKAQKGEKGDGQKGEGGEPSDEGGEEAGSGGKKIDLEDLAKRDWSDYAGLVETLQPMISQVANRMRRIREMQVEKQRKRSRQMEQLPQNNEINRLNRNAHRDLIIKQKTDQDIEDNDLNRWQKDKIVDRPTTLDIVLLIDGSASMNSSNLGHGNLSAMHVALASAIIMYEAAKTIDANVYIAMWGNDDPLVLAEPGVDETTIGKTLARAISGLQSGTRLTPSFVKMIETIVGNDNKGNPFSGYSHFMVFSDGDIDDPDPSQKTIETMFDASKYFTLDFGIIKNRERHIASFSSGYSPTAMEKVANNMKSKLPHQRIDSFAGNDPEKLTLGVVELLLDKLRGCNSFIAVPQKSKKSSFRRALLGMKGIERHNPYQDPYAGM